MWSVSEKDHRQAALRGHTIAPGSASSVLTDPEAAAAADEQEYTEVMFRS